MTPDKRMRCWSPMLGDGVLVYVAADHGWPGRWEGDDGRVMALNVGSIATGTPAWNAKHGNKARPPKETAEVREWVTLTLRDGSVMGMRRGCAPDAPKPARPALPGAT